MASPTMPPASLPAQLVIMIPQETKDEIVATAKENKVSMGEVARVYLDAGREFASLAAEFGYTTETLLAEVQGLVMAANS